MVDYEIGYAPSPPFGEHEYRAKKALIGSSATLIEKTFTENGVYTAEEYEADGFSAVDIEVVPNVIEKTLTANGTYDASKLDNVDGYSKVVVDVPTPPAPTLVQKAITQNGTYLAQDETPPADGFSQVTVAYDKLAKVAGNQMVSLTADDLAGVTGIKPYTFYSATNLMSIDFPETINSIGEQAFYMCSGLTQLHFPASISSMGQYCFSACYNLTSVTFAKNILLPEIATRAFAACSMLPSIIIPASVSNFGEASFRYCNQLKKVVVLAETPPTLHNADVFYNNHMDEKFYVPTPDDYKVATNWAPSASKIFPLVSTVADLANIDTTTYTKACVVGADESYAEYTYDGSQWNEVV